MLNNNTHITTAVTPVTIIGAGPVGLTLGCQLLKNGIPCQIIEKRTIPSQDSKALSINAASLNIFYKMNIVERFLERGKKISHIYVHWKNQRFMHIDYTKLNSRFCYFLSLPQSETEKILAQYFHELGGNIERNTKLDNINIDSAVINLSLHQQQKIFQTKTRYLIACDGSKSIVRQKVGLAFEGYDYNFYFLLIDCTLEWKNAKENYLHNAHYFVGEKGFIIIIPLPGIYYRIVIKTAFQLFKKNNMINLLLKDYQDYIDAYGPGNIIIKKIIWRSGAPFYHRLIESYHYQQRIFFAGDAAHLFSPIGGLGMNTGLQDSHNLAWKLTGVLKKNWPCKILETYNQERRQIGAGLIKSTDFFTRLITRTQINNSTGHYQDSAWLPVMQNRLLISKTYPHQFSGLKQHYHSSEFIQDNKILENKNNKNFLYEYECEPQNSKTIAGHPIACLTYADNLGRQKNLLQLLDYHPVLLVFFENYYILKDRQAIELLAKKFDITVEWIFSIIQPHLKIAFKAQNGDIFLLRPDGYIGYKTHLNHEAIIVLNEYLSQWYSHDK